MILSNHKSVYITNISVPDEVAVHEVVLVVVGTESVPMDWIVIPVLDAVVDVVGTDTVTEVVEPVVVWDVDGAEVVVVKDAMLETSTFATSIEAKLLFAEYPLIAVVDPIQSPGIPTEKNPTCRIVPSVKFDERPVRFRVPSVAVDGT